METWIKYIDQTPTQRKQLVKWYAKNIDRRGLNWVWLVKYVFSAQSQFLLTSKDGQSYISGHKGIFYPTNGEIYFNRM